MQEISSIPSKPLAVPEFRFDLTAKSAAYSWTIVKKYGSRFNAINAQDEATLELGSEFRSINTLEKIFGLHPLWNDLSSGIKYGFNYPHFQIKIES